MLEKNHTKMEVTQIWFAICGYGPTWPTIFVQTPNKEKKIHSGMAILDIHLIKTGF